MSATFEKCRCSTPYPHGRVRDDVFGFSKNVIFCRTDLNKLLAVLVLNGVISSDDVNDVYASADVQILPDNLSPAERAFIRSHLSAKRTQIKDLKVRLTLVDGVAGKEQDANNIIVLLDTLLPFENPPLSMEELPDDSGYSMEFSGLIVPLLK